MNRLRRLAWIACALCLVLFGAVRPACAADAKQVNFGRTDNVLDLKPFLSPYRAPGGGTEADGSSWYIVQVSNDTVRPAARVLLAGQPPHAALSLLPRRSRPSILAVASSDSGTVVETASAYGRRAWRVIVPPVSTVGLAIRVGSADTPPALAAWTEPALSAHNRQLAIFITAVGALIAAAALITGGLAVLIGHAAPRWVALSLLMLLFSWLAGTGMFDASLTLPYGGPYGLSAFLTMLALAAGMRLANAIIPVRDIFPKYQRRFDLACLALIGLGGLAYVGVPLATVLSDVVIVLGSLGVAVYLVYCGRRGHKAAQVIAPGAGAFALVAIAAAVVAVGGYGETLTGPAATGGFAAAGAILLALAVIASEEIAVLPFLHGSYAAKLLEKEAAPEAAIDPHAPFNSLARAAVAAAHQGVFDLDFRSGLLTLSVEAVQMVGLAAHETTLSHSDWLGHVHPDDRDVYNQALETYRKQPGQAFRLEFRARGHSGSQGSNPGGPWRWLELRATIISEQDGPSDCLGLLSDITQRKELAHGAPGEKPKTPSDPLTGLGNRVALMQVLDGLGASLGTVLFAVLDVDRFKAIHASLGDKGADTILRMIAERLTGASGTAQVFRVGGDSFAILFTRPAQSAQAIGNALADACAKAHRLDNRDVFAPCSIGLAAGAQSEDPFALIKNAELALIAAKRQGGACARLYSAELETLARGDSVALESELRNALAGGQLDVFYQPIVKLQDRTIAGFEALLRWRHPVKGLISPADFIAHSEETGLIVALGRFALERAASDLAHWQRYFPLSPPLFASVNLSRRQLQDTGFVPLLKSILDGSGIVEGTLNLEVTESAIASDRSVPEIMARIRASGAGLSIDDFGTGASTLSELRNLPVDTVKIDRSFLARHESDGSGTEIGSDGQAMLSGIVSLAHELKRAVVAEGVESEADAQMLARLGCEFGQGYYFSPPLDGAAALDYIARHYNISASPQTG